jgi:hypothetical protein
MWSRALNPILDAEQDVPSQIFNATLGSISRGSLFGCASALTNGLSLARKARVEDNYLGQLFLGNIFSGAYDSYITLKNTTNGGEAYTILAVNGVRLGLPGGGAVSKGLAGVGQDSLLRAGFQNLGKLGAQAAADAVGDLKVGYDFLTFGYEGIWCALHR